MLHVEIGNHFNVAAIALENMLILLINAEVGDTQSILVIESGVNKSITCPEN